METKPRNRIDSRPEELKVVYKRSRGKNQSGEPYYVKCSQTAEQYLRSIWDKDTFELIESFYVLYLNSQNQVLGWIRHNYCGLTAVAIDVRLIYAVALKTASTAILVAHNHPGGSLKPSSADHRATKELQKAGDAIGVKMLDHIILTRDGVYSFADSGEL